MKHLVPVLLAPALLLATVSCVKDDNDATPDPPIAICGIDGMRMSADVDGADICFSTSLVANLADEQLAIGGIHPSAGALAVQLDETTVGTHGATGDMNHVFLTVGGIAYQSTNENPGSITITSHNTGGNRIKGSFTGHLFPPDGSPARSVAASFEVIYLEQ